MKFRVVSACWVMLSALAWGPGCTGLATGDADPGGEGGAGAEGADDAQGGGPGSGGGGLANPSGDNPGNGGTPGGGGSGQGGANAGGTPQPDGGTPPVGDAGVLAPPPGLVPMFVAAGQGGRTITSCDDGRSWIANHAYENSNQDHSPYTHKGLAYGNGMFMVILAWGADVSLKTSTDGVTWTRNTNFTGGFYGGVAFGGDRFAMLRQGVTQYSSDLGKTWTRARIQPRNDYREGGGGHGLPGAKGVFGGGGGDIPSMSWDGGETFTVATGCPAINYGGIGQEGGVAAGGGHLVFMSSSGEYCHVTDGGKTITKGTLGSQVRGKLFFTGGKFWATSGNIIHSSPTGATWTRSVASPTTVSLQAIAIGESGTFVGVGSSGADFYRSADGVAWQKVAGVAGTSLFRVVFGYGSPSAMCPGR